MKKDLNFLKGLRSKLDPGNMAANVAKMFLPQLEEIMDKMDKPVAEGGVLKEGQEKLGFLVLRSNGQTRITVVPIWRDERVNDDERVMGKPVSVMGLDDLLSKKQLQDGNTDSESEAGNGPEIG